MIPQKAVPIKLLQKQVWREGLVSLRFEKPDSFTFKPGQFVRLGIEKDLAEGAAYEGRPYSMASLPEDPFLEFFIVEVQGGRVSGALTALEPGQSCYLEPELWGSMLPERIPGGNTLWCISSGPAWRLSCLFFRTNLFGSNGRTSSWFTPSDIPKTWHTPISFRNLRTILDSVPIQIILSVMFP